MTEPPAKNVDTSGAREFPFLTAAAAFVMLFAFVGLMIWAYNSPNYLGEPEAEPRPDPGVRSAEVTARNQALLDGKGAKMSVATATGELLGMLKTEKDRLPFPAPELPQPPTTDPKKK